MFYKIYDKGAKCFYNDKYYEDKEELYESLFKSLLSDFKENEDTIEFFKEKYIKENIDPFADKQDLKKFLQNNEKDFNEFLENQVKEIIIIEYEIVEYDDDYNYVTSYNF